MIVTTADNGAVGIWDPKTGALLAMRWQPGEPLSLAWQHDGSNVLVASNDGHVRIWGVALATESGEAVTELVAPRVPYRLNGTRIERVELP